MDTIVGHNGNVLVLSLNFYKGLKVFIVRPSRKNNFTITPEALVTLHTLYKNGGFILSVFDRDWFAFFDVHAQ